MKSMLGQKRPAATDSLVLKKEVKEQQSEEAKQEPEFIVQPIQEGAGKLITSGKTVHGFDTQFSKDLEIGDTIIVILPDGKQEVRKVNMVLSAKSCGLEEPFSTDLMDKVSYLYQKKPKVRIQERALDDILAERLAKAKDGEPKEDEYEEIEMKVKKGQWGYNIEKKKVKKGELSREEILDMRAKKKTDKFCWF